MSETGGSQSRTRCSYLAIYPGYNLEKFRNLEKKYVASLTGGSGKDGPVLGKFDNIYVEGKSPLILFEIRKFSIQLHMKRIIANWKINLDYNKQNKYLVPIIVCIDRLLRFFV